MSLRNKRLRHTLLHSKSFTILCDRNGGATQYGLLASTPYGTAIGDFDYQGAEIDEVFTFVASDIVRVRNTTDSKFLNSDSVFLFLPETGNEYELTWNTNFYEVTNTELSQYIVNKYLDYFNFSLRLRDHTG